MTASAHSEKDGIRIERDVTYVRRDEGPLTGTLYRPAAGDGPHAAIVAVHGGGWRRPSDSYAYLGPWLAQRGYVVFAPRYRLAARDRARFPDAVHDVRAAVQFVRGEAGALEVDPDRIALMGDSAGGNLAALVALAGDDPAFAEAGDVSTRVKVAIPVYGVYDMARQWLDDLASRPREPSVEVYLGQSLVDDRRLYFDASPLSYVTRRRPKPDFLLAWGSEDDIVPPGAQSLPFLAALKQADFYVRTVIAAGAPHYWLADPIDEAGSFSAFFAARLLRFLEARL